MNEPAEDPTIYEVIRGEHTRISELLDALADEASEEPPRTLLARVRDMLERHARAEEAVFYDILMQHDEQTRALAREAEADHAEIRRLLAELDGMSADDSRWQHGVSALTLAVERHVESEESTLFEAVEAILDDDQARTLAETFEAMESRVEPEAAA